MEWLAVASARTPGVASTTRAETTSQTLASTRISGAVCRASSVDALSAGEVMAATTGPVPGSFRDEGLPGAGPDVDVRLRDRLPWLGAPRQGRRGGSGGAAGVRRPLRAGRRGGLRAGRAARGGDR